MFRNFKKFLKYLGKIMLIYWPSVNMCNFASTCYWLWSEFTAQVHDTDLKQVHGKRSYPQSQGSVERANGDIKDMLVA
jgi:hypothetical protein